MKVTILGTGTFYVTDKRSGPAYLLEADGKKMLIDCGPGTLRRLSQIGISPNDLDYIFITHFHADHTTDLFALQMNIRLNDFFSEKKLEKFPVIYGPKGIEGFTKKLSDIYELPAFDNFPSLRYEAYNEIQDFGNITVRVFKVDHQAFRLNAIAYALRFEIDGKIFTFSGDGTKCEGLEKACRDSDLFICDTSYTKGNASPAHLDTYEIGEVSQKNNVKKVVLTHIYPNLEKVDLVGEVKEKYDGEVVLGEDLMEIEI